MMVMKTYLWDIHLLTTLRGHRQGDEIRNHLLRIPRVRDRVGRDVPRGQPAARRRRTGGGRGATAGLSRPREQVVLLLSSFPAQAAMVVQRGVREARVGRVVPRGHAGGCLGPGVIGPRREARRRRGERGCGGGGGLRGAPGRRERAAEAAVAPRAWTVFGRHGLGFWGKGGRGGEEDVGWKCSLGRCR